MYFIEHSFLNVYINTPITFLHNIPSIIKVVYVYIYLCLIPYFNYLFIIANFLFILFCLNLSNFPKKFTKKLFFYFFILFIFICFIDYYNNNQTNISIITGLYSPNPQINFQIQKYINLKNIKNQNNTSTSIVFIQITIISIYYFIILKILYLTTRYEEIIINILLNNLKYNKKNINEIILIVSFASQFLQKIIEQINILFVSIKLRSFYSKFYKYYLYKYIIINLLKETQNEIKRISSILYSREIKKKNKAIYLIDIYNY